MMCTRCKKRPAVVFVSNGINGQPTQGLCLVCAKELGIKPVNDIMEKMGITDEELEAATAQMTELMNLQEDNDQDTEGEDELFAPGGAATMPVDQMLGGRPGENGGYGGAGVQNRKESFHKKKRKYIQNYCTDLTGRARRGELDNIVGREKEIQRVVQILSRRTKNNPCLIGEPGVGKTAVAEGLALRIAQGQVPAKLRDKEVQLLDLTALVAGTQFRGQFESRIKGLVDEVKADGNVILFIDEVHNLVGTGDAEGSMNAANILKPALSRGEIQVIGATTFNEYRKYIEKDAALERRFQPVTVAEPSVDDAVQILLGIKGYYENYHRVKVSEGMCRRMVVLAERYINDRYLPDKAIDLLDEACACAALRNKKLEEYDEAQLSLTREKNREQELSNPTGGAQVDYEELAKTHYRIATLEESLDKLKSEGVFAQVEEQDVAKVIELWTGIPAARVQENELKKLAHLEDVLKKHIIGQDEAVNAISAAIRRSRVQISPRRHPASFIFVGPTGTGKTELVRVLSQELFDTPETLIRLDMSEFMEKHSVSKIIGSPPGYVGYDEAGQLTEKVRRRPYSVLLFDEIEKAHPDVLNILLQILDEGRITDAHGRTVNFENTVIVMTSNAGSDRRENALGFNKTAADMNREKVMKALGEFLRPEFLSRIDEVIVFRPLDVEDYKSIAALMLDEYVSSLGEKGITLTYTPEVCAYLAEKSIHGQSGARDLRNNIRRMVEDKLAMILVEQGEGAVSGVGLTMEGQDLKLNVL
ncbi:MAG TPA: ATP-dependent Clp protease ATP-binding subunit [Candidatus Acutalibacter pullicola]|uniref:ATP-dependent Clp protease ATP-binding subunit n=1 Tax=Candidatus Acutalibacter pullicola TaxID=2838417 RepID=A0A9D2MVY7_9FIRM|nr:ATP-dependent Clp protease ATP-binding subunit [Candidatus Acutalibacter pullicola]